MLLFHSCFFSHRIKLRGLLLSGVYCLAALSDKLPQMSAFNSHMRQNANCHNFFKSEPLLPCDCYAIKNNIRTIRSQVLQPDSAGNGADLVNCKLTTAWYQNSEPRHVCSLTVISANKTAMARFKSVKLPTSGFYNFFILSPNFQKMPVFPPCRRPWLVGHLQWQVAPFS